MGTYECHDCSEWVNSYDSKMSYHEGRYIEHRWCKYDRTYRAFDQKIYSCRGFHPVGRAVITKVCEILNIDNKEYFNAFDEIKEEYIIPTAYGKLVDYNDIASTIADGLENHPKKENIAKNVLEMYIIPAFSATMKKQYDQAVEIYERMVKTLAIIFDATKEQIAEQKFYNNLISIK